MRRFAGLALLVVVAGCASPNHFGRGHVRNELAARTGHMPGLSSSCAGEVTIPPGVFVEDGIDENEAIEIGLSNHAGFQALLADLEIAGAGVITAGQLENPSFITMFPVGVKQWEYTLQMPVDVLCLRPIRVAAAQAESHRVAHRLAQDGINVVRDIRTAYVQYYRSERLADLAQQNLELNSEIARIAEEKLAKGDIADLEVAPVRLEAMFRRQGNTRAQRDVEIAREQLRFALGIGRTSIEVGLPAETGAGLAEIDMPIMDVEAQVADAVASRPDIRAAGLGVAAAVQRAELARKSIWQVSGVFPDINSRGREGFEYGPGLMMSIPILHQNQGAVATACAEAHRLLRQRVVLQDTAAMEIRQAAARLSQASAELALWREEALPQAKESVRSAQLALDEDAVSLLLVLEGTRQLLAAQQGEVEAEVQLRLAIIELERSIGRRLRRSEYDDSMRLIESDLPSSDDSNGPIDSASSHL